MRILIIDNHIDLDCWGAEELRKYARLAPNATIITRRAPEGDLPLTGISSFDRILVSGSKTSAFDESPWTHQLIQLIQSTITERKPYLGICYGHQMLARAIGGFQTLRKAPHPEFGWSKIHLMNSSPLFRGLPNSFYSFSAHCEEVASLPQGMKILARSKYCQIQGFQLENLPLFGIQFHPEKSLQNARQTMQNPNFEITNSENRGDQFYNPKIAESLFNNFFKL